jgi:tRNA1(Val) A37 N6-methylase TrmN6
MIELSKDFFLNKRIIVYQPKSGYRFSIDAPLLADFIKGDKNSSILEIGGGCGIISLILLKSEKFNKIFTLEIQKIMIKAIKQNIIENKFTEKLSVFEGEYLNYPFKEKYDIIFSNPPYYKIGQGKISTNISKAIAKFEIKMDSDSFFQKTYDILSENGSAYIIYPYIRINEIKKIIKKNNFFIKRERIIFPRENREPVFFMFELKKNKVNNIEKDSLVLEDDKGNYYPEIEKILRGEYVYN